MGLPRDLVELEAALRVEGAVDPFAPIDSSGLLMSPAASVAAQRLREFGLRGDMQTLRILLQALRIQHENMLPNLIHAELVATLPVGVPGIARTTDQVLLEMLRPPVREVILLGYELTDDAVVRHLVEAEMGGAGVIVICDRTRGVAQRLLALGLAKTRVYQDKERLDGAPYSSMHAKCLLVDGRDLLITSANFTFHGLHGNIEIGVRLSGSPAAEARKIFSHLVESGAVEEVSNAHA